jgi:hypothetical protein
MKAEDEKRHPPRTKREGPPIGEDFETMTARYGRPRGPFEKVEPPRSKPDPAAPPLRPASLEEIVRDKGWVE